MSTNSRDVIAVEQENPAGRHLVATGFFLYQDQASEKDAYTFRCCKVEYLVGEMHWKSAVRRPCPYPN